jgi:hypothetical protein
MQACCPTGLGCNAKTRDQLCVLQVFELTAPTIAEAATALACWKAFRTIERQGAGAAERRFRRRVYERAREEALATVAIEYATRSAESTGRRRPAPRCRPGRRPSLRRVRLAPRAGETAKA